MQEASSSCVSQYVQNIDSRSETHYPCDDRAGDFFMKPSTCPPVEETTLDLITSQFLKDKQRLLSNRPELPRNKKKSKGKSGKRSVSGQTKAISPSSSSLLSESKAYCDLSSDPPSDCYSCDSLSRSRSHSRSRPRPGSPMQSRVSPESEFSFAGSSNPNGSPCSFNGTPVCSSSGKHSDFP